MIESAYSMLCAIAMMGYGHVLRKETDIIFESLDLEAWHYPQSYTMPAFTHVADLCAHSSDAVYNITVSIFIVAVLTVYPWG